MLLKLNWWNGNISLKFSDLCSLKQLVVWLRFCTTDGEDQVARAIAIQFEEKGGVYYNNEKKINNEKVAVADIAQFVVERTLSQYEEEFEVVKFSVLSQVLYAVRFWCFSRLKCLMWN